MGFRHHRGLRAGLGEGGLVPNGGATPGHQPSPVQTRQHQDHHDVRKEDSSDKGVKEGQHQQGAGFD